MSEDENKEELDLDEAMLDSVEKYMETMLKSDAKPYYVISGSGPAMYYSIGDRSMVLVHRGTEVIPMEKYDGIYKNKRVVFVGDDKFILVNEEDVISIGFN